MKRTFKHETHLVELKREIPGILVSQENKLTGGFVGVSGTAENGTDLDLNVLEFCFCIKLNGNCGNCNCGGNCKCSPTPSTPAPTPVPDGPIAKNMLLSI